MIGAQGSKSDKWLFATFVPTKENAELMEKVKVAKAHYIK